MVLTADVAVMIQCSPHMISNLATMVPHKSSIMESTDEFVRLKSTKNTKFCKALCL